MADTEIRVGEFIDTSLVLPLHGDHCQALREAWLWSMGLVSAQCSLERIHDGPHADCSLSGLVLEVWDDDDEGCIDFREDLV